MAISAIFLMIFLLQHLLINITSLFSADLFNYLSHLMGTSPVIQFIAQPILILGVLFHFIMGFFLEFQNRSATKYGYNNSYPQNSSTWMSRNMIISGVVIFAFLILHFIDFWIPEINYKYVKFLSEDTTRYYPELVHKFTSPTRVVVYCISFIFLSLHLQHGFTSSIKSVGANKAYTQPIKSLAYIYSIGVPTGFCVIAIFHYFNN